jgi:hypothetical protein
MTWNYLRDERRPYAPRHATGHAIRIRVAVWRRSMRAG